MRTVYTEYLTSYVGSAVYRDLSISVCISFSHYYCLIYDFTPMIFAVPMWGSEVAKSKTEIHLTNTPSEVKWACDVTTIEREDDFTSLGICYFVW